MRHIQNTENYSECESGGKAGEEFIAIGGTEHITDFQICEICKLPMRECSYTHYEE